MDEVKKWYAGPVKLKDAESYIGANMVSAVRAYVANGYWLKRIRDEKLFLEEGYKNFEEYVRDKYSSDKGWASKCIKVNQELSVGGDSPVLDEKYKDYSVYQLVELARMTDEQRDQASPDQTVRELREMRKPREIPYIEIPGQTDFETSFPEIFPDCQESEPAPAAKLDPVVCTIGVEEMLAETEEAGEVVTSQLLEKPEAQEKTGMCAHRDGFPCMLAEPDKQVPGDGEDCTHKCCWKCVKHGDCKLECYASAQRPEGAAETQQDEPESCENRSRAVATDATPETENDPKEITVPFFSSELSNDNAYGWTWDQVVKAYLAEMHKVRSGPEDGRFPDAVISSYGREYQASVKDEQIVFMIDGEIQFIVNMDRLNREYNFFYPAKKEELSAYGTKKRIYPPDSLIATPGCEGGHDCFSCAMECQIRQADRYCREAPMGNPFPCEHIVWGLQTLRDEIGDRCQFVNHDLADHCAGSGEADPCCKDCGDPCEYICARAMKQLDGQQEAAELEKQIEAPKEPETETRPDPDVIDTEYTEVPEEEEYTAQYFLQKEQRQLDEMLEVFKDEDPEKLPKKLIARQKIIVAALAAMVCDLEETELKKQMQWPRAEQPELPEMRNNDQRKEFLNTFHEWPVWFRVPEASEVYYRYDLPDQTALVICEYRYYAAWMKIYSDMEPDRTGTREFLLTPGYHYLKDCQTNRSAMIEKLKEIQKKG